MSYLMAEPLRLEAAPEGWIALGDLAAHLGITGASLRKEIASGRMVATTIGPRTFVRLSDAARWQDYNR